MNGVKKLIKDCNNKLIECWFKHTGYVFAYVYEFGIVGNILH